MLKSWAKYGPPVRGENPVGGPKLYMEGHAVQIVGWLCASGQSLWMGVLLTLSELVVEGQIHLGVVEPC